MPTQEDLAGLRFGPLLLPCTANGRHPLDRELMLPLGNPPCLNSTLRQVGEENKGEKREGYGDNPIDDKQPLPLVNTVSFPIQQDKSSNRRRALTALIAINSVQVRVCSRLQETTEHLSDSTRSPEDHGTFSQFARSVPRSQKVMNSGIEASSTTVAG